MNRLFRTHDLPGIGGRLKCSPDDFVVEEVPAYAPSGTGDHVFVFIEKRELTTPSAIRELCRALRTQERDVGCAGLKDKYAVTRQWLSLPPPVTPDQASAVSVPGLRVLAAVRHGHKLRTGHLRANRFTLVVRDVRPSAEATARALLDVLTTPPGLPNYYGEQRFGNDGDNAAHGRALLGTAGPGRRPDRRKERLFLSALQSDLFNQWLAHRLRSDLLGRAIVGDVLHKVGGGLFVCDDPATDTARIATGEVVVTGPMFGATMRSPPPGTEAAAAEDAILAAAGLDRGSFEKVARIAPGTRRDASAPVQDATIRTIDDGLELCFTLPTGAYATTLMAELMKVDVQ